MDGDRRAKHLSMECDALHGVVPGRTSGEISTSQPMSAPTAM
jgi:hypothetical protein